MGRSRTRAEPEPGSSGNVSLRGESRAKGEGLVCLLAVLLVLDALAGQSGDQASLWDLDELRQPPRYTVSEVSSDRALVLYEVRGKNQYACLSKPTVGTPPFPAVVCVSGFGEAATLDWSDHWAQRGYVALVIDSLGTLNGQAITNGVAPVDFYTLLGSYITDGLQSSLHYEKIAAGICGVSFLASLPEVDPHRIGVTGLSWGGPIACIVAGVDDRVACVVPTYGSAGEGLLTNADFLRAMLPGDKLAPWIQSFDAYYYLSRVRCPILLINGSNDIFYHLALTARSYNLASGPKWLSVRLQMNHGENYRWPWYQDTEVFMDACLKGGQSYPTLTQVESGPTRVTATLSYFSSNVQAGMAWTTNSGYDKARKFNVTLMAVLDHRIEGPVPPEAKAYYLFAEDMTRAAVGCTPIMTGPAFVAPVLSVSLNRNGQDTVSLAIDGQPGTLCEVQASADLSAWQTVDVAPILGQRTEVHPKVPLVGDVVYYRVLVLP